MKKTLLILFICLFFLGCLVPVVGLAIAGPSAPAANEIQAAKPQLRGWDGSLNEEFLAELSSYIGNGFWGRLESITAWNQLTAALTNSTENEQVILGRHGWLFYYSAADEVSGQSLLSERAIWCCARNLWLMQRYADEQGANFLFLAPNGKYDLYSDYMKSYICLEDGRNIDRLQTLLDDMGVRYADMYSPFMAEAEILYWKTDSHWNGKGAALAADAILKGLGRESDYFAGEFEQTEPHLGDLYEMVYPKGELREPEYIPEGGFSFAYSSPFRTVNDLVITTEQSESDGKLLMFRDSFARNLYPYLAERFGEAEFSRINNYELYRIPEEDFSDVVIEVGVKNLAFLMQYPALYPSVERDMGVLEGCEAIASTLTVGSEHGELEGYACVTGDIAACAVDSPVYLRCEGLVFEAMPNEMGFTAYLDASLDFETLEIFVRPAE